MEVKDISNHTYVLRDPSSIDTLADDVKHFQSLQTILKLFLKLLALDEIL